ncbi:hypothetical protein PsorP6_001942 [Peronosclerospora sorghi]|uniref:Uncharacterized protein n=1 Tax=Peronosclerospora sorghi TaxID=230839 RepID=A0ACC0WU06_9STRA|nr:hypothetical protein PsorP6_001942 [Peronosclerospora sorghi]
MTLDAATLARLKVMLERLAPCLIVKDLQLELKKRGLDPSGLKTTLVQRLQDHLQQQIQRKKERQGQKQEGPPRKRRHRGGRKRNRRNRFQRR